MSYSKVLSFNEAKETSAPEKNVFYLVKEEILPEAIKKTIKVKEILKRGEEPSTKRWKKWG